MLQQRAVCATCTHPILHIPFVCDSCEGSFCLECFDSTGLPLCVVCTDAQLSYISQRARCDRCPTWVDEPTHCLCGGIYNRCMQHLSFCLSCNRAICNVCFAYCIDCGSTCPVCNTTSRYESMVKCDAACKRWICRSSACHFQTNVANVHCCKKCLLGQCKCLRGARISKPCAYPKCVECVCSTTQYVVCHAHELTPCFACNITQPKLGNHFVLRRESCKDCYKRCFLTILCLKRMSLVKPLIALVLKFAF
jgi:hypothetical protein